MQFIQNHLKKLKGNSAISIFLHQLNNPLIIILVIAGVLTYILGEHENTIIISIVVVLNSILGFYQEYKAHSVVEKLKSLIKSRSLVERNGKVVEIDSQEIRVGDIVILTTDYKIPADGEIIEGEILADEHILTGESISIEKKTGDTVYMGTYIVNGYAKIRVEKIGNESKFGQISDFVTKTKEPPTPLQTQLNHMAKIVGIIVVIVALVIFIVGLIQQHTINEMLSVSIAVAVASVPEGLVIALTMILAIGMNRIHKEKALIRKLLAAESLGSVTTICVDKTGTLTTGQLVVTKHDVAQSVYLDLIFRFANNELDVLDKATKDWYTTNLITNENIISQVNNYDANNDFEKVQFFPFTSKNKFTAAIAKSSTSTNSHQPFVLLIYGSADVLLNKSNLSDNEKSSISQKDNQLSKEGYKVIGYAYKILSQSEYESFDIDKISDLTWLGTLSLRDTLRKGINKTFQTCKKAGINIKMITGDHYETAISIALEAGFISESEIQTVSITGAQIDKLSDQALDKKIKSMVIFARTTPMQKLRIIESLNRVGEIVAMTGDGINDAPALKKSAIGVVVNEASDVSKEIADMILIDSNLGTIVKAVEEGRRIFQNIRKVILFLFTDSLSEIVLVLLSLLLNIPIPFTAAQVLWINLLEDALPALALTVEPKEKGLMEGRPLKYSKFLIDKRMRFILICFFLITDLTVMGVYYYMLQNGLEIELIRTVIFALLGVNSIFYIFSCKSIDKSIFHYNPFNNRYLNIAVLVSMIFFIMSIYLPAFNTLLDTRPLQIDYIGVIVALGIFNILILELLKWSSHKIQRLNEE